MDQAYKNRHPLAWTIIVAVALFSAVAVGAIKGWLPIADDATGIQACSECATVEFVRTVEIPMAPLESEFAGAEPSAAGGSAITPDSTDVLAAVPEAAALVAYSYETTVRFEDGTTSVISQAEPPTWQPGDKVKIIDGLILVPG